MNIRCLLGLHRYSLVFGIPKDMPEIITNMIDKCNYCGRMRIFLWDKRKWIGYRKKSSWTGPK